MKSFYLIAISVCFLLGHALAQKTQPLRLKNGFLNTGRNLLNKKTGRESFRELLFQKKYYALVRFDKLPGIAEKKELASRGIALFDFIPGNAFMAEISDSTAFRFMKNQKINAVYALPPSLKISEKLLQNEDQFAKAGEVLIAVSFFGTTDKAMLAKELEQAGAQVVSTKIQPAHTIFIRAPQQVIQKIALIPPVTYISSQRLKDVPLNYNNRAIHALDALSAGSGRNLQGKNVVIGIGDNADPSSHIDFAGRLIQRNPSIADFHGTHTAGTAAGGGILNPLYKGMAPKATLVTQMFSDIIVNTPVYMNDYHMVITNNSYYNGADFCPGDGEYDVLSNYLDEQLNANPSLLHVFAAGNDGTLTCSPYPPFFATIKSGFQCAKNALSVGAIDNTNYTIKNGSSRGPVADGRVKPEIMAGGQNIISTAPYNNYGYSSGTSMAAPTVTGTLALLYERYRQLHGGLDPEGALIKAVACNSADDLGNPGPDFSFGFGMLNARTAVETIEKNQYFSNTISNGGTANHSINLLSGVQQLKVMLYWPDAAAAPYAPSTLVNDLDLTVTGPDGIIHYPMILDPSPANVNNNAVEGADHTNNIEQVVINNPPAGDFSISVNGSSIPGGSQNYIIAYQIINPSVTLEYPFGNETWVPGQSEIIRWSAYGGNSNTFTLEYSPDNGSTWNLIDNNIASASRSYTWTVPSAATSSALIRITRNNVGYSDVSDYTFSILDQPTLTATNPCPGYAQLNWNSISSATQYEIMMLKGDSMQTIASTNTTAYLLDGLNKDSSYWLSVRAVNNTTPGRRSVAVNIIPNSGPCAIAAFNYDFTIDSLIYPLTGRMHTSSELGPAQIQVRLKNLGSIASASAFNISYQVNGGTVTTENSTQNIPAAGIYNYTFSLANSYDFSAAGTYQVKVWIDYPGDPLRKNDTLLITVKQLQNDPLVLSPDYTEGFENAAVQTYATRTMGLEGLDRCDFNNNGIYGRARTFINTGFARTGNRCITLDKSINTTTSFSDSLITTFNLSNYTVSDQIWLNYYYKNQGIDFILPGNQVWIRGNDQAAWIPVDTLSSNLNDLGIYKPGKSIDVTGILAGAVPAQTVSSSFQIKFGEQGYTSTNSVVPDGNLDDGYSFDDITITRSVNDAAMEALLQPKLDAICYLSNAETITVKVKSYSASVLTNVPVSYAINGNVVTETIPVINPFQSANYTFSQKADLSAFQHYDLRAWVSMPADNYQKNDTLANIGFQTTPVISSYPYLEGFENNNGYWYTQGINSSWQWGKPNKTIINKAANGSNAWVTNLTGNYNDNQLSYLYSPCFDLSSLTHPVLSFSHIFKMEDGCDCDYHWMEYSTNDSVWIKLGSTGAGTNWYDNTLKKAWQLSNTKWHVSSFDIPVTAPKVRFRMVMYSDPFTDFEGVGIDDVHIFDKVPVYDGSNSILQQNVSGNDWIHFDLGGKRMASVNPHGQDLGNTTVKLYVNTGPVRDTSNQYYLDRNIVIQPTNAATDSVSIRFYFLDAEVNKLIMASGCSSCTSIHDAYEAGVTQYSSPAAMEEDSTLSNNFSGNYHFHEPQQKVNIIPYDKGYYAEYRVGGFSEFWINGGGTDKSTPLAATLQSFTAGQTGNKALLQWSTYEEKNTDEFVIEKSTDSLHFTGLDSVPANGNTDTVSHYQLTDNTLRSGNNYYRLKTKYADGHSIYSPVRNVPFAVLQSFTAGRISNHGILEWRTYQKANTAFIIEKSADSIHFSDYITITASSTDSVKSYSAEDNNLWNGNNYYRLRVRYTADDSVYSAIRNLPFDPDGFVASIYPNPVSQRGMLYINTSVNCREIALFDVSGRLIQLKNSSGFQNRISVGALAKGVYFLIINTDAGKKREKIIVE